MPLFYFDLIDGDISEEDLEGVDLPDLQTARDQAADMLVTMSKERLRHDSKAFRLEVRIRGAATEGSLSLTLHYSEQG